MWQVIAWVIATVLTFPIIAYISAYKISLKVTNDKRKSMLRAFDVGALFLLLCIHFTSIAIFEKSLLGTVLLVSVVVFLLMGLLQKYHGRFSLVKAIKGGWRANGFIYIVGYIVLFNYGLVVKIIG